MDSNLLKEAIADAKAVRQTALANAKAALEEAFGRRFEAMFAPKLEEDSVDTPPVAPAPTAPIATAPAMEEDVVNETDIDEIIRELEAEVGGEEVPGAAPGMPPMGADAGAVPPVPPAPAPGMGAAPGMGPVPGMGAAPEMGAVPPVAPAPGMGAAPIPGMEPENDEMDEEIDINELLESLKDECEDDDEDEKKDGKGKPPWLKESVPAKSSGVGTADNKTSPEFTSSKIGKGGDVENGVPEGKVTAKEPTQASRPNQAKNATKTNLSTPGGALKENTGGSTPGYPEGAKKTSTGDDPSEADRPNQADHATKDDLSTVPSPLKEEVTRLRSENKEYKDAVVYLKGQLNEINLLNAKLLYTNKLFKEYSMANDKKMKVVEMFDLAKNVREVKMTYAVIAESLNFGAEKKTPSKVQTITEGMASRPVASTRPGKQIIAESAKSEMVNKFQKLAGIKTPSTK